MMDYHELIDALTSEDNPYVLDYIDDAVEMLEHLYSELKAANARCETLNKMVTQYQDELIPGYRERAEKSEAQLSQYTASGLEPCDYTAMRSAIDGEKEARQSLELPCKVGDRLRLEARGTCYYTVTSLLVLVTQQETRIVIDVLDDAGNSDYFFSESIGKTVFRVDRGQRQKEEV